MKLVQASRLLKRSLAADAGVSGAVAVLHVAVAGPLAAITGLPHALILGSGLFLVGYVLMLVLMARSPRLWSALVKLVVAGNLLWAAGCLALAVGLGGMEPGPWGIAWLLVHAMTVTVFALLESRGLGNSAEVAAEPGGRLTRA